MPEWSIGAVSKTVVPLREPRVRIPVLPPKELQVKHLRLFFRWVSAFAVNNAAPNQKFAIV